MAFAHDHMTVTGHQVGDRFSAHKALEHGDIDHPARATLAVTDPADGPGVDVEEHRKLRDPLFEKRPEMHQHERVPGAFGNHANAGHRFAHARRRDQDSDVMGSERAYRVLLKLRRSAVESMFDGVRVLALIVDLERGAHRLEQRGCVVDAPAWKRDMPGEVLRAVDDSRRERR